jgi:eukaryotic-like serine/threonine-protein kinase
MQQNCGWRVSFEGVLQHMRNWSRVKEILASAMECDPAERSRYVHEACGNDEELRTDVESLLLNRDGASSLLGSAVLNEATDDRFGAMTGKRIGAYRLIEVCGRGGMAVVWLAERDDQQFRKRVAVKIVQPRSDGEEILRRFYNERQTLAALDHPNIVKLLDGGSTEEGWPYLVMEYVEGTPIDQYCDRLKLSVDERLSLFQSVCAAVHHAHQNLVIHRDLKPGNILVTKDGIPRLLDFGIAKVLNPEYVQATLVTRADWHPMTPEYASPEQVRGETISTATDIYSLGVLLYRLLCGCRPYRATAGSWLDLGRQICDEEPENPSAAIYREKDLSADPSSSAEAVSEARNTNLKELRRRLRGDIDAIVLKALRKESAERYRSVEQVSADIFRYLHHEPVIATAGTTGYRIKKYVRRHRVGVGAAAALLTVLVAFAVIQAAELRRITRERDRANRITDFMTNMFRVSDPSETRGNSVTAREILDKAAKDVGSGLARDPELQAQMMFVMGQVYNRLGLYSAGRVLLQQAYDQQGRVLGPHHEDTLRTARALGWNLERSGHDVEAEKLQRQTLAADRRVYGSDNIETLSVINDLTWTLQQLGQYAEAEKLAREALEAEQRLLGTKNSVTLQVMANLGSILTKEGRYTEAETIQRENMNIRREAFGADSSDVLSAMNNLGITLRHEKRLADAEQLYREMLETCRRVMGPEHPLTLRAMNNLGNILGDENKNSEKEQLHREILAIRLRTLGPEHPETLSTMANLADALASQQKYDEAAKLARQALDTRLRILGPDHPDVGESEYTLVMIDAATGKYDDAISILREAVTHGFSAEGDLALSSDPALSKLHRDPRFVTLTAYARQRAATLQSNK